MEALDADKEMIYENYLETNLHLERSLSEVFEIVKSIAGDHEEYERIRESFAIAMSADRAFIDTCYQTMIDNAGSPQAYLEKYFNIDKQAKEKLKKKYCEDI